MKEWVVISCFKDNKRTAGFGSQVETLKCCFCAHRFLMVSRQHSSPFSVYHSEVWNLSMHRILKSACSNVFWSYAYLTCRQISYVLSRLLSFVKAIGNSANKFKRIPSVAVIYKFFLPAHPLLKELLPWTSTWLLNMHLHPSSYPSNFTKNTEGQKYNL